MQEDAATGMRETLAGRYPELRTALARRLGSDVDAREALSETFLRVATLEAGRPGVINPFAYILRIAINLATDRRRAEQRLARRHDVDALLEAADPAPDQARALEASADLARLREAMLELPSRQRDILIAARLDGLKLREIAQHLGISQRLVEMELRAGLEHCASRLQRPVVRRFGPQPSAASSGKEDSFR